MKRLSIKHPEEVYYPEDVERIREILLAKGYWSTRSECTTLWQMYSDSLCAGWLMLPDSDEALFESVKPYIAD